MPTVGKDGQGRTTYTFSYTGAVQNWVIPAGVTKIKIEAWGAQGGRSDGGKGGYAYGDLNITPSQSLDIYVGGQGQAATGSSGVAGGWNGGGSGGGSNGSGGSGSGGSGGGGSSDVRSGGTALANRILVASGGGAGHGGHIGGYGGGTTGGTGSAGQPYSGAGGSQTAGGAGGAGASAGALGVGGNGRTNTSSAYGGGGGGGGYYGGGGGDAIGGGAGGGGSSYVGALANNGTTADQRTGNGLVVITVYNTPPTLALTSPTNNQTLSEGSTYNLEGTISDVDAGQALSVKYSIAGGPTQTIALGTSDGANPKSFSKILTYSQGRFWDGSTDVSGLLPAEASSIQVWANDGSDDSTKVTRNITVVQEDGKVFVPVNVVSSAYLVSRMAPPVRLSNGWLVGAVVDAFKTSVKFYKSSDNGKIYSLLTSFNIGVNGSYSILCKGTNVYCVANGSAKVFVARFDATNVGATIASAYDLDVSQSAFQGVSLAITPDGTKIWWAASTKNSNYPNSFNIRAGSIPINGDGTLGTPSAVAQISNYNTSGWYVQNPSLIIKQDGNPALIAEAYNGSNRFILAILYDGASWSSTGTANSIITTTYTQSSPMAIRTPNGKLHVAWHGTDASDTVNPWIRYSNSADGSSWLPAPKKLVKGTNASITSDKNGKLIITYEDGGYIKRIESSNEFVSFSGPFIDGVGTMPATFYDQTFATDFSIPPTIYQTTGAVKYRGVLNLNKKPVVTLDTPDNQTLTENSTLKVSGQAVDEDVGDVVSVFYKINSGPTQAAASSISDGSTPILFDKTLTYRNKRIYLGDTDITGIDLAENTDHILTVSAEDNKQGKSLEVTRKLRVVWNRPPVIDGQNKDLGIMEAPPVETYTVTEPESNPFTVTEKINGVVIRTFPGVADRQESITIPKDLWLRLEPGVPHTLTIEATDNQGMSSTRTFTLTRFVNKIVFNGMDFNTLPEAVKLRFTTDVAAKRILFTPTWIIPPGATILVEVCNNAYDALPTWEDATIVVKLGRAHLFNNVSKTADKWGINFRFRIDKANANSSIYAKGGGGAFD
ncbi:glycine-rich protein [Brevibacillus sp. NPDC003359]|uniref:glycine-rich protein n=1 Tax=unclassified Brevibacillus TaxID=2684853 RepID=UPI003683C706